MSEANRGVKALACAAVVLMLGGLSACEQKSAASEPPAPVSTPMPVADAPYYTSTVYGFTLDLPTDWEAEKVQTREFMGLPTLYAADAEGDEGWLIDIYWMPSEEWENPDGWNRGEGGPHPVHFLAERNGLVLCALLGAEVQVADNRPEECWAMDARMDEVLRSFALVEDAGFPAVSYGILTGAEGRTITVDLVEKRPWEELRELPSERVLYHSYYNEIAAETVLPVAPGAAVGLDEGAVPHEPGQL